METNYRTELYVNVSVFNGQKTIFRILAGPGNRQYRGIDLNKDRLLFIQLEKDGIKIEYPYKVDDQLAIWELVFDVWQKPEKKLNYAKQFMNLIYSKLLQTKLQNFAKAYWGELTDLNR
jgi:hypothetical protein